MTLKPRFNAVATGSGASLAPDELPPAVDCRQVSLFAAAWTLGSLAALLAAGASSITLFETTGWRGIIERETASPWPAIMPDLSGRVFPVFQLLRALAGTRLRFAVPPRPDLAYAALVLSDPEDRVRILVGNVTGRPQQIPLRSGSSVQVRVLNEEKLSAALSEPETFWTQFKEGLTVQHGLRNLELSPYALACVAIHADGVR